MVTGPQKKHVALTYIPAQKLALVEKETLPPGNGEVLVRLLSAGICGTDIQILRGQRHETATILGHEGIGQVEVVGSGVTRFSPEDYLTFNPTNPYNPGDILGHSSPGVFQHYLTVSAESVARGLLVPCDKRLPLLCSGLIEPLAVVLYAQELIQSLCHQRTIAIVGGGPIGILMALYARHLAIERVLLIHNTQSRLAWAVRRGIVSSEETYLASALDVSQLRKHVIDAVYLCTTRPSALVALRQAIAYVRDGGCLDLIGGFGANDRVPEIPQVDLQAIRQANIGGIPLPGRFCQCQTDQGKTIWLTGHRGVSDLFLYRAMDLLLQNTTYYTQAVTHRLSIDAALEVLEALRTGSGRQFQERECVKMVIDYTAPSPCLEHYE